MLAPFSRLYFQLFFKEPLAFAASHAVAGGPGFPAPRSVFPAFRSAVLPGGGTGHSLHQVHPGVLELRSDEPEAEEEDPEVVLGAGRVVRPLVFGRGAGRGLGFRRDCEAKLNVGFYLYGVGRAVEEAELDRAHPPHVVEVDVAVAVMLS